MCQYYINTHIICGSLFKQHDRIETFETIKTKFKQNSKHSYPLQLITTMLYIKTKSKVRNNRD